MDNGREKALLPELLRKVCFASAQGADEQEGARGALQVQELQERTQEVDEGAPRVRGGERDLEGRGRNLRDEQGLLLAFMSLGDLFGDSDSF